MNIFTKLKQFILRKDTRPDSELTDEELLKRQQKRMMKKRMRQIG